MGRDIESLNHLIPLKVVLTIFVCFSGILFGATGVIGIQSIRYLVSIELGYSVPVVYNDSVTGDGADASGACSADKPAGDGSRASADGEIQERTALIVMVNAICGNVLAALVTIVASSKLDKPNFKRKVALLPCVAFVAFFVLNTLVMGLSASAWFTVVPTVLIGLGGNFYLQLSTIMCYITSITGEKERSTNIVLLLMAHLVAQGIAQISSGYLITGAGFVMTYFFLTIISVIMTVFVFLFLPNVELPESDNTSDEGKDDSSKQDDATPTWRRLLEHFRDPDKHEWNWPVIVNFTALFVYNFVTIYFLIVLQIVQLGAPFCWSPDLIGYFGATKLVFSGLGMSIGVKILKLWFEDDNILIQIGMVSCVISTIIPIYARTDAGLFLVTVLGALRMVPMPVMSSNLSKLVDKNKCGSLFGITTASECIASSLAPIVFGSVYGATLSTDPMFVFKFMAGLVAIPSTLILYLQCKDIAAARSDKMEESRDPLLPPSQSPP